MLQANYKHKKDLKAAIGQTMRYTETSAFGPEFKPTGMNLVCNKARTWYASVETVDGVIKGVK